MSSSGCLIIDDVQSALAHMTSLGRDVATAPAIAIRAAVLNFAVRRKWYLLEHQAYVDWCSEKIRHENRTWLVLDPLFPKIDNFSRLLHFRVTRNIDANPTSIVRRTYAAGAEPLELNTANVHGSLGIIDDAAATGSTLRDVGRRVTQAGGEITHILLGASSREARNRVCGTIPPPQWAEYMRGDWSMIHLRDGCPHLPFSGRPTRHASVIADDGTCVDVRVPSSSVVGSLWHVLLLDAAVKTAVSSARTQIARTLSDVLGRPARVVDLSLLGASAPALINPGDEVTADTRLDSLFGPAGRRHSSS